MIPVEAIAAAAKVHFERGGGHWDDWTQEAKAEELADMRAALEAAAPHMLVPTATEQALDRILVTLAAVAAGQVPQDVAFTVIREISERYTDERVTP